MRQRGNKYVTEGNVTKVFFNSKDEFFLCDSNIVEKLKGYTWYKTNRGYAAAHVGNKHILAHVLIMGKKEGLEIDHINRNKLDNRMSNLRFVSHIKNLRNVDYSTRIKNNPAPGVSINNSCKNYTSYAAYIRANNKKIHLGCFGTLEEAIRARKEAEVFYWGNQVDA